MNSNVPSEGSRLARTGAAMLNIFRKGSQSPKKLDALPAQNISQLAARATGTFGGFIASNLLEHSSNLKSPQPKV